MVSQNLAKRSTAHCTEDSNEIIKQKKEWQLISSSFNSIRLFTLISCLDVLLFFIFRFLHKGYELTAACCRTTKDNTIQSTFKAWALCNS